MLKKRTDIMLALVIMLAVPTVAGCGGPSLVSTGKANALGGPPGT